MAGETAALAGAIALGVLYWMGWCWREDGGLPGLIVKTGSTALLVLFAFLAGGPWLLVAGLALSSAGDAFLAMDKPGEDKWLKPGMAAFFLRRNLLNRRENEQKEIYRKFVPESGRVLSEIALGHPSTKIETKKIVCPVLIIGGGKDTSTAMYSMKQLSKIYSAELKVYENSCHFLQLEKTYLESLCYDIINYS